MKQLTIEHLAPYLPYGLMFQSISVHSDKEDKTYVAEYNQWKKFIDYSDTKPLLRPLSQLTQEIEHNGKRFVPIEKLKEIDGEYYLWLDEGSLFLADRCKLDLYEITRVNDLIKKLFEWHFDIFGLLEQGLALPIKD